MRHLFINAQYIRGETCYRLISATDQFVVLRHDGVESVMDREDFANYARLVHDHRVRFVGGVLSQSGATSSPMGYITPYTGPQSWCIDLDLVPEEAWVSGWNP